MIKKNIRYLIEVLMITAMLCGLNGCGGIDSSVDTGQGAAGAEDIQAAEQDSSGGMEEAAPNGEHDDMEKEASGEDLDVAERNAADDDWYMKGNIYTDDNGNRLEVFFDDYGALQFAVNGLSLYYTAADNFQQENNWKVYTCDDGTMIGYFPGEPAHIEIGDGDYAGLYEEGGDKVN